MSGASSRRTGVVVLNHMQDLKVKVEAMEVAIFPTQTAPPPLPSPTPRGSPAHPWSPPRGPRPVAAMPRWQRDTAEEGRSPEFKAKGHSSAVKTEELSGDFFHGILTRARARCLSSGGITVPAAAMRAAESSRKGSSMKEEGATISGRPLSIYGDLDRSDNKRHYMEGTSAPGSAEGFRAAYGGVGIHSGGLAGRPRARPHVRAEQPEMDSRATCVSSPSNSLPLLELPRASLRGPAGTLAELAGSPGGERGGAPEHDSWRPLGIEPAELDLELTLPTGQTFRWRRTGPQQWTGVIGHHLVSLYQGPEEIFYRTHPPAAPLVDGMPSAIWREDAAAVSGALDPAVGGGRRKGRGARRRLFAGGSVVLAVVNGVETRLAGEVAAAAARVDADVDADVAALEALRGFLGLETSLRQLWDKFSASDDRFAALAGYNLGTRILHQDPAECLFQFICSSNNNIARITALVEKLAAYGPYLATVSGNAFHSFPSISQLAEVKEEELRAAGFGYRAKYIVATAQALDAKPGGGELWLRGLRGGTLSEAVAALCELPGVGPKVAACVALFSLGMHHAVPIDTHVWQFAVRHYLPEVGGKTLTPRIQEAVAGVFLEKFGDKAGWAINAMFVAELPFFRERLPIMLQPPRRPPRQKKARLAGPEVLALEGGAGDERPLAAL